MQESLTTFGLSFEWQWTTSRVSKVAKGESIITELSFRSYFTSDWIMSFWSWNWLISRSTLFVNGLFGPPLAAISLSCIIWHGTDELLFSGVVEMVKLFGIGYKELPLRWYIEGSILASVFFGNAGLPNVIFGRLMLFWLVGKNEMPHIVNVALTTSTIKQVWH